MHVLLIEPDIKLATIYSDALHQAGHTVAHTTSAQRAVQLADDSVPDVVVLELQLTSHNGIEFVYEFRSYAEWQAIPIVLLTMVPPHALAITPDMLEACNIVQCLYKPATNLRQLIEAVEDAL